MTEMNDELPALSHQERRELCRRVLEIESEDEIALCDHAARRGFALLDQVEAEGEARARGAQW